MTLQGYFTATMILLLGWREACGGQTCARCEYGGGSPCLRESELLLFITLICGIWRNTSRRCSFFLFSDLDCLKPRGLGLAESWISRTSPRQRSKAKSLSLPPALCCPPFVTPLTLALFFPPPTSLRKYKGCCYSNETCQKCSQSHWYPLSHNSM